MSGKNANWVACCTMVPAGGPCLKPAGPDGQPPEIICQTYGRRRPRVWNSTAEAYSAVSPVTTVPPVTLAFSMMAFVIFSASSGFSRIVCFAASRPCPTSSPR